MTQSREPNDRDILTRIAALEYQMTEIQNTQVQLRATIASGGYVTDAFERVINRIEDEKAELKADIQDLRSDLNTKLDSFKTEVDRRFDSQDAKLDILIRHMTGMGQEYKPQSPSPPVSKRGSRRLRSLTAPHPPQ